MGHEGVVQSQSVLAKRPHAQLIVNDDELKVNRAPRDHPQAHAEHGHRQTVRSHPVPQALRPSQDPAINASSQ